MPEDLEGFSLVIRRWLPPSLWMAVIVILSLDWGSGSTTYAILHPLLRWLHPTLSEDAIYSINLAVRKLAHIVEFAILAILVWRAHLRKFQPADAFDARGMGFALFIALLFSIASEVTQYFIASRVASISDIFIDMGGALLGLILLLARRQWQVSRGRLLNPPPLETPSLPRKGTRVLFAADLHLPIVQPESAHVLEELRKVIVDTRPDICVIAGDICPATYAESSLAVLRQALGDIPIAICLGNQDHWLPPDQWAAYSDLESIRTDFWHPALSGADISCLDFGNVIVGDVVLTGGYGHYNLKMRVPELASAGETATLDHYHAGAFAGLGWNDMQHIPHAGALLDDEAHFQATSISQRLTEAIATDRQVLVVTHTVPFADLIRHSDKAERLRGFFDAYAGNSLVGAALADHAGRIALAVCGHTHSHIPPGNIRGVTCLNLGPRFALYDSFERSVRVL